MLITGWEDLALNALPSIVIDPYFWQTPPNVLIRRLEEEEALNACDPYFWQTIHIFGKALRVTINGLPGPKDDFFTQTYLFPASHPTQLFFLQKTALILVNYSLQSAM